MKSQCDPTKPVFQPSIRQQVAWFAGLFAVCFSAAGIGGWVTSSSVGDWYQTLSKPGWNPPAWVFGPVWSALYAMMAVAAWLVWRKNGWKSARAPLFWFAVQLGLNVGWSVLFFGLQNPGFAFAEILVLLLAISITVTQFWSKSKTAAWIMTPYLAWTTFAAGLNYAIWRLNA